MQRKKEKGLFKKVGGDRENKSGFLPAMTSLSTPDVVVARSFDDAAATAMASSFSFFTPWLITKQTGRDGGKEMLMTYG